MRKDHRRACDRFVAMLEWIDLSERGLSHPFDTTNTRAIREMGRRETAMNTYEVEIQETLTRLVTVEASSPDEAIRKVSANYKAGEIVLDSENYIDTNINLYVPE